MKKIFSLLLIFLTLACTKQEIKPQMCFECTYYRVEHDTLHPYLPKVIREGTFESCEYDLEFLTKNFNFEDTYNNKIHVIQKTTCKLKTN